MKLERKELCPLLKKKCIQMDCAWFIRVDGEDPQDGKDIIEEWGCAVTWNVAAVLQVAKDVRRGTGGIQAATESFRNEMVVANERQAALMSDDIRRDLMGAAMPALINGKVDQS